MPYFKNAMLFSICVITVAACAPSAPPAAPMVDTSADQATFRDGTVAWLAAYNAGDADKIVAMYTDDAVVMPPDKPAATGHAAIREFLVKDMAETKAAGIKINDVNSSGGASGDLGWHAGTFSVSDASGKTVGTGKYSEVWKKKEGKWLMIRDMWNNDAPPPPPPASAPAPEAAPTT